MGFTSVYPWAEQRYIDKFKVKDKQTTQDSCGFRISGFQVWQVWGVHGLEVWQGSQAGLFLTHARKPYCRREHADGVATHTHAHTPTHGSVSHRDREMKMGKWRDRG
eukprot:359317-Chlamydomonas_euryale.AAC.2